MNSKSEIIWKNPYKEMPDHMCHVLVCLNIKPPYNICTTFYCPFEQHFQNRSYFDLCDDIQNKFEECVKYGYKIKAWAYLPKAPK